MYQRKGGSRKQERDEIRDGRTTSANRKEDREKRGEKFEQKLGFNRANDEDRQSAAQGLTEFISESVGEGRNRFEVRRMDIEGQTHVESGGLAPSPSSRFSVRSRACVRACAIPF